MKNLIAYLFVSLMSLGSTTAQQYILATDQSTIDWKGSAAFSAYELSGIIKPSDGSVLMKGSDIVDAVIRIDMTSLEADNKDLQRHLRSDDFFDVNRYKTAQFELTGDGRGDNDQGQYCSGLLTIKDKSQDYNFSLTIILEEEVIRVQGVIVIDRTLFGITFNSPSYFEKLKDQAIADEFELEIDLVFIRE